MELRIKEILKQNRLTISAFANMVGITQANLSNILNGKSSPTLETLNRIAESLNIDIVELFKEKDEIEVFVKYQGKTYPIYKSDIINFIKNKENI